MWFCKESADLQQIVYRKERIVCRIYYRTNSKTDFTQKKTRSSRVKQYMDRKEEHELKHEEMKRSDTPRM